MLGGARYFSDLEVVVLGGKVELHLGDGDGHHSANDAGEAVLKVVPEQRKGRRSGSRVSLHVREEVTRSRERSLPVGNEGVCSLGMIRDEPEGRGIMRLAVTDRVDGNADSKRRTRALQLQPWPEERRKKNSSTHPAASALARTRSIWPRLTLSVVSLTRHMPEMGFRVFRWRTTSRAEGERDEAPA
jgi:hypothetical protein